MKSGLGAAISRGPVSFSVRPWRPDRGANGGGALLPADPFSFGLAADRGMDHAVGGKDHRHHQPGQDAGQEQGAD